MSALSQVVSGLEERDKQLGEIDRWAEDQHIAVMEWRNRPSKLRLEAARAEVASMSELASNIAERKSRMLTELPPGEQYEIVCQKLDTLESLVI